MMEKKKKGGTSSPSPSPSPSLRMAGSDSKSPSMPLVSTPSPVSSSSSSPPNSPNASASSNTPSKSRKRKRRTADEIKRHFHCTWANCTKSYGSESALKMHIKLKHEVNNNAVQTATPAPGGPTSSPLSLRPSHSPSWPPSSSSSSSLPSDRAGSHSKSLGSSTSAASTSLNTNLLQQVFVSNSASPESRRDPLSTLLSAFGKPNNPSVAQDPLPRPIATSMLPTPTQSKNEMPTFNFSLRKLRMGNWERQSACFGDLIARVGIVDRSFFWESVNLEGIVRATLPFSTVSRIQIESNTVIHVSTTRPPAFSLGVVQPGLPTAWKPMPDFLLLIGGNCLTHTLTLSPENVGFPSFAELVLADPQLKSLLSTPLFVTPSSTTSSAQQTTTTPSTGSVDALTAALKLSYPTTATATATTTTTMATLLPLTTSSSSSSSASPPTSTTAHEEESVGAAPGGVVSIDGGVGGEVGVGIEGGESNGKGGGATEQSVSSNATTTTMTTTTTTTTSSSF